MVRIRTVVFAFLFAFSMLLGTHLVKFPGSVAYLMERMGDQRMLDQQASASADEVYRRLDDFGDETRQLYMRTIITIDFVFPLSVFLFLFLMARLVARPLQVLPIAYLIFDFMENASVLALLANYPQRLELIATCVGYLTQAKRMSMLLALLLPIAVGLALKGLRLLRSHANPRGPTAGHGSEPG